MHTIYLLRDPLNPQIGYVGQTRRTVAHRLSQHLAQCARGQGRPLNVWLRGLKAQGLRPVACALATCDTAADAERLERGWIRWARKGLGLVLVNATAGGQARYGERHAARVRDDWQRPERRAKARAAWSDPVKREARLAAQRAALRTPDAIARNRAANKEKANRPEQKAIARATIAAQWADPEKRARRCAAVSAALKRKYEADPDYRAAVQRRNAANAKKAAAARWGTA